MLPERCSVKENEKSCVNPPEFVISVQVEKDEYMVGVTCSKHKSAVSKKIEILQQDGKIPKGKISFDVLKSVGTDCVKGDTRDLIEL